MLKVIRGLWQGLTRRTGVQSGNPGGYPSEPAAPVTFDNAMTLSAVWSACRLRAETVASLPLVFYEPDGITPTTRGELPELFSGMVNRYQTRVEFFETFMMNRVVHGNAYALKQYSGDRLVGLLPLMSAQVETKLLEDGSVVHAYHHDRGVTVYPAERIWHSKIFGNGIVGLSALGHARNSMGIALAAENRVGRIYRNGGKPTGVLTIDRTLKPEQREQIRKEFRDLQEGNEDSLMVLEADLKYNQVSLAPTDIQLLESRRFQIEDLARFLGVPSVLINDTSGTTVWGSGISEIIRGWHKLNLRPELVSLEASMEAHLRPRGDRTRIKFDMDDLLRPERESRMTANQTAINSGQITPNEARAQEGRPPIAGGDQLLVNGTLVPVAQAGRIERPRGNE
ncbi:MAG TPA: phage portal protein [Arenicellales bacterium]|nr:phage portal protein [Arenicellales bacterium]